jgi:hypothetical protein
METNNFEIIFFKSSAIELSAGPGYSLFPLTTLLNQCFENPRLGWNHRREIFLITGFLCRRLERWNLFFLMFFDPFRKSHQHSLNSSGRWIQDHQII